MTTYTETIHGIEFIGNKGPVNNTASAYTKVLVNTPKNEVVIVKVFERKTVERRLWAHIDPAKLVKALNTNKGLYEVIMKDRKRKVYFDVDDKNEIKTDDKLEKAIKIIKSIFPEDAELNISGNKENNSYHIVINNYYFKNNSEQKRLAFMLDVYSNIFDKTVYTSNRSMKCINQSKPKSYIQQYISGSKKIEDHLITCFFPKNSIDASTILKDVAYEELSIKKKVPINTVQQMNLKLANKNFEFHQATPLEILKIIPNPKRTEQGCLSHESTWIVANFSYYNSITFEDFWAWCKNKDDSPDRASKWFNYHWNKSIPNANTKIKYGTMGYFLERFYPTILDNKDKQNFVKYHNITGTKIIDSQYIKHTDFTNKKVQILALGLGANKTGSTIDYLKANDTNSYCLMTPRITLGFNILGRMREVGVNYQFYQDFNTPKKKLEMHKANNLVIQINSLHYLSNRTIKYNCVVIDEIESVLNGWKENDTMSKNLVACWNVFRRIVKEADKVILIDALISKKTLNFLKELGIDKKHIEIIKRSVEPTPRDLVILPKSYALTKWITDITQDLCKGKKVFVFYPYKKGNSTTPGMMHLIEMFKLAYLNNTNNALKVKGYTADTDDKEKKKLDNVNKEWEDQNLIICNQAITVGVNYDKQNFDVAYILFHENAHVRPRDVVQVSMRMRTLKENQVKLLRIDGNRYGKNDFEPGFIVDGVHKRLVNDIILEDRCKTFDSLYRLFKIANYKVIQNDTTKNEMDSGFFFDYQKIYEETIFKYSFENIEMIGHCEAEKIYEKIWYGDSTYEDKMRLYKYKFVHLFTKSIEPEILSNFWTKRNMFQSIHDINECDWINDLLRELKLTELNLPSKLKISNKMRDKIFNEVKFDRLSRDCSNEMLVSRALNAHFKPYQVYYWQKNKDNIDNKNGSYQMNEDFYWFIEMGNKYFEKNNPIFTENMFEF